MIARRFLAGLATMVGLAAWTAPAVAATNLHLFAVLRGANELAAADPDGSGTAMITFRGPTLQTICVQIFVDAIDTPLTGNNGAHIHRGGGNVNGAIVVFLNPPAGGTASVSTKCVAITAALSQQIRANPYGFYINIHTGAFGGGAIRGQLF